MTPPAEGTGSAEIDRLIDLHIRALTVYTLGDDDENRLDMYLQSAGHAHDALIAAIREVVGERDEAVSLLRVSVRAAMDSGYSKEWCLNMARLEAEPPQPRKEAGE